MKELPDEIVSFILSFVENPRPITNGIIKYLIYDCYEEGTDCNCEEDSDCDCEEDSNSDCGSGGPEPCKTEFFIILFTKNIPK